MEGYNVEYMKKHYICNADCKAIPGGGVLVVFTNYQNGESFSRKYKTMAAAKGAVTKILQRMARIYG